MDEYKIIIPQIVNKFPELIEIIARTPIISSSEFIRKLKLDKVLIACYKDKEN